MRMDGFRFKTVLTFVLGIAFQLSWLHDLGMLAWLAHWSALAPIQSDALLSSAILALAQVMLVVGLLFHQPWARTASAVFVISAVVRIAFADAAPAPATLALGLAAFFVAGVVLQDVYRGPARRRFRSWRVGTPAWPALANGTRGQATQDWIGQREWLAKHMTNLEQALEKERRNE